LAKLTTQAGWVSVGRVAAALVGLVTAMVLSRVLPPAQYGTYRQTWLVFYALAPLLELGLPASVAFYLPRMSADEIKSFLVQHGLILLVSGSLMAAAFLSVGGVLERHFGSPGLSAMLRAFALFPVMILPFKLTENALIALGRARLAGGIDAIGALGQSAFVLGSVLWGAGLEQTFLLISLWAAARWLLATASLLYLARRHRVLWARARILDQLRYALPIAAAAVAGIGARQVDQLIVSWRFSPEAFAVYVNGAYDLPLIHILTFSASAVLVPAIVRARERGDAAGIRRLWHGTARRLAWVYFPAFAFLLVAARPLMVFLFSETYAASAGPFRVLLFLLPLRIALHGAFLRALGRSRPILYGALGTLLISTTLALLLVQVRPLGLLGPALAATAGGCWGAYYTVRASIRAFDWSWGDYFPWRQLAGIMAVAALAAAPTALVGRLVATLPALHQLAAMGGTFATIYLVVGHASHAAPAKEWLQAIADLLWQR
jgi:O-antigen/teichoic acid export membrane protein